MTQKSLKTMAILLFLLLSGFKDSLPKLNLPKNRLNICYISLNNKKEFELTKSFLEKIQQRLGVKDYFSVTEFQEQGKSPEQTFAKIVKSGHVCDGLVISGHHTGSFGGNRASGTLKIDALEKLSCEIENEPWFGKVNSLWLQGCRTLGTEKENANTNDNLAEYHAQRVARVRELDGLNQTQTQLEEEFASVLDSETPYATRFFKTFFNAKIYGWTMSAPGEGWQSEKSILYHVGNVGRRLLLEDSLSIEALENPTKEQIGEYAAATYFNALVTLLSPNEKKEEIVSSIEGWVDHGKHANKSMKIYGFNNPDLKAYPPLMVDGDKLAVRARHLDCSLRRAKQPGEIEKAVADVLETTESIAFSFYTIKEVLEEKMREVVTRRSVKKALTRNKNLMNFLNLKIGHKNVGVAKKLDYVGLYLMISEDRENPLFQKILQDAAAKLMMKNESNNYDRSEEKQLIVKALIKNNLVTIETLVDWINRSEDENLVNAIANTLTSFGNDGIKMDLAKLTRTLLGHPRTSMSARSSIIYAVTRMAIEPDEVVAIMKDYANAVVLSNSLDFNTLLTALGYMNDSIPGIDAILENIYVKLRKSDAPFQLTYNGVAMTMGTSDSNLGALIKAACNPHLKVRDWQRYVLEVFELYKTRNANLDVSYHLSPLVEALDMRDELPPSMFPILKVVSNSFDKYDANSTWRKMVAIKLLAKSKDFFDVARAEKNKIIQGGNQTDIQGLVSALTFTSGPPTRNVFEVEDLERIYNGTEDTGLHSSILYGITRLPKPNAKVAAFLRERVKTLNDDILRPFLLWQTFAFEPNPFIRKSEFFREFVDNRKLSYMDAVYGALIVVSEPDIVANPTLFLAKLYEEQDFNPYLKGILIFHLIKQPATNEMRRWMNLLLNAQDFTAESINIVIGMKTTTDIFAKITFKQLKTYFKMVGRHPAMEPKTRFEFKKDIRRETRFNEKQKAELLALLSAK